MGILDIFKGKKKEEATSTGGKTIKVGPRDTLKSLAKRYYDDETVWVRIYEVNKWRIDGDELVPGQECTLPAIPGKGPKEEA
ncbi:MAG TPA: LysM peptidoglycan-binding domain-containing protein [Chloroflexota bacterium]|nr:LysM peptidoglycan-binding domain-containing protein [Chloroflexota bacterium]